VPVLAIMLAMVSAFPAFAGVKERLLSAILADTLPPMDAQAGQWVRDFIDNASRLTGLGLLGLAVTAVLLLNNITAAFNTIWRVHEPRALATRLLVYWALLTLGPLLVGVLLTVSGPSITAVGGEAAVEMARWLIPPWAISIGVGTLGFAVLYLSVPNRGVRVVHALAGGLATATLFELLTVGFGLYLRFVPGYEAVYGAVAALPIFLLWLYLSWAAVLLGAEVTAALPEWRAYRTRLDASQPGARLALAIALLRRLRGAQLASAAWSRRRLVAGLPATPAEVDDVLGRLRQSGLIARTAQGRWVLAADPRRVTLGQVMETLALSLDPGQGWPPAARRVVDSLAATLTPTTAATLDEILAAEEG
jgi:membrane protein